MARRYFTKEQSGPLWGMPAGAAPSSRSWSRSLPEITSLNVISVSPDGGWLAYVQEDQVGSDLILVENFR